MELRRRGRKSHFEDDSLQAATDALYLCSGEPDDGDGLLTR